MNETALPGSSPHSPLVLTGITYLQMSGHLMLLKSILFRFYNISMLKQNERSTAAQPFTSTMMYIMTQLLRSLTYCYHSSLHLIIHHIVFEQLLLDTHICSFQSTQHYQQQSNLRRHTSYHVNSTVTRHSEAAMGSCRYLRIGLWPRRDLSCRSKCCYRIHQASRTSSKTTITRYLFHPNAIYPRRLLTCS
jgi:hypothetical protein